MQIVSPFASFWVEQICLCMRNMNPEVWFFCGTWDLGWTKPTSFKISFFLLQITEQQQICWTLCDCWACRHSLAHTLSTREFTSLFGLKGPSFIHCWPKKTRSPEDLFLRGLLRTVYSKGNVSEPWFHLKDKSAWNEFFDLWLSRLRNGALLWELNRLRVLLILLYVNFVRGGKPFKINDLSLRLKLKGCLQGSPRNKRQNTFIHFSNFTVIV